MTTNAHSEAWAGALSEAVGRAIHWDGIGECVLEFKDDVEVVIAPVPDSEYISMRSALTPLASPVSPQQMQAALSLNYGYLPPGFSTSLEAESGQMALLAMAAQDDVSRELVAYLLERFVALVPQMRERLRKDAAAPDLNNTIDGFDQRA